MAEISAELKPALWYARRVDEVLTVILLEEDSYVEQLERVVP